MNLLNKTIFNRSGDDDLTGRAIWGGNSTNLINVNNSKYDWAISLWRQMRGNFWVAEKVDLSQDKTCYLDLLPEEKRVYKAVLGYLTFLDSIQVANLPQLKQVITAPEIRMCLGEQESQEVLHSQSYSYCVESVIPEEERAEVFNFWRTDDILFDRMSAIASYYQEYVDDPTPENYFVSLFADYLLEGLYFYSGFGVFYTLSSRSLMTGTSDMISYIQRDEISHIRLVQKLIVEGLQVFPHSIDRLTEMVETAAQQEILWMQYITDSGIIGINDRSIADYCKYLANLRMASVGLPKIYEETKNPYKHLDKIADTGKEATKKANFFEVTVTGYNQASTVSGWDEF